MKLIHKTLILLSFAGLSLDLLEAKSVEFIFDQATQSTGGLKTFFNPQIGEESEIESLYCQKVTIENQGSQPVQGCYPSVNQQRLFTLDRLAQQIANEPYPALALFEIWNHSLSISDSARNEEHSPLDLLNFVGVCSQEEFSLQFIRLCHQLGIRTRLVNRQGQPTFDFSYGDGWTFLDLNTKQLYLSLDNQTPVSSEAVMDDPFLALRAKHDRRDAFVDFKKGWEQLALFEITHPFLAEHAFTVEQEQAESCTRGFDLYPQEKLVYHTPATRPSLLPGQREVDHVLNCQERGFSWAYASPFPIKSIYNGTSSVISLKGLQATIQPGESFACQGDFTFHLLIELTEAQGQVLITSMCSKAVFPALEPGDNEIDLGLPAHASSIHATFEVDEKLEDMAQATVQVVNESAEFDYCTPRFYLADQAEQLVEKIWWQISSDPAFSLVPSNFEQIEPFTPEVTLSAITETFFNAKETYYFRVRGGAQNRWGAWSEPFAFTVNKPEAVSLVEFEKKEEGRYELNWERESEEDPSIDYLVFGSNSLDFIPCIYCDSQINAVSAGEVTEKDQNQNLIAITKDPKLEVDGTLAYYRIIARQHGQLSVPSALIHVYDEDLIQPRNVLQVVEEEGRPVMKRVLLPATYPWTQVSLPMISTPYDIFENSLLKLHAVYKRAAALPLVEVRAYQQSPHVSAEVWESVRPYFLPENHPVKAKLDRMFSATRVILTPETFKKAGFKRYRPGRFSRIMASPHPDMPQYFFKAFADNELTIKADWFKFRHRIEGAKAVKNWIQKNGLQSVFSVPNKWIYPLPENPSPPNNSYYLRKNFILVADNMRILEHDKNEKAYKKRMTRKMLDDLYRLFDDVGLYDSVYAFNVPFCKDGRLATIDTEYHHRWPVPFHKIGKYFSKDMQKYWQQLIDRGGPKGHVPQHR